MRLNCLWDVGWCCHHTGRSQARRHLGILYPCREDTQIPLLSLRTHKIVLLLLTCLCLQCLQLLQKLRLLGVLLRLCLLLVCHLLGEKLGVICLLLKADGSLNLSELSFSCFLCSSSSMTVFALSWVSTCGGTSGPLPLPGLGLSVDGCFSLCFSLSTAASCS